MAGNMKGTSSEERVDYEQYADEELVEQFAALQSRRDKERIRDTLFGRYYCGINKEIKRTLTFYGLPYDDSYPYYNTLFDALYSKVFILEPFEQLLKSFNSRKGAFSRWFLRSVISNKIRDWLRTRCDKGLLRNGQLLKSYQVKHVHLDAVPVTALSKTTGGTPKRENGIGIHFGLMEKRHFVPIVLERLNPKNRIVLKLLFLPQIRLGLEELVLAASLCGKEVQRLSHQLLSYQIHWEENRYKLEEEHLVQVEDLRYIISQEKKRMFELSSQLERLGFRQEEAFLNGRESQRYLLKDLRAIRREVKRGASQIQTDDSSCLQSILLIGYMEARKRCIMRSRRLERIQNQTAAPFSYNVEVTMNILGWNRCRLQAEQRGALEQMRHHFDLAFRNERPDTSCK